MLAKAKSEPIESDAIAWMARAGYAARGVVYLIIGVFAVLAALGARQRGVGGIGALEALLEQPFGSILLAIVAGGLLCFALWRLVQAIFDTDHHGNDARGLFRRVVLGLASLFYFGLAGIAVSMICGRRQPAEDQSARDWTAWLLAQPFGQWLTAALGGTIVIVGFALGIKAWRAEFRRHFKVDRGSLNWIVALGIVGSFGRAIIFALIGTFLVIAAFRFNSGDAAGMPGALRSLQSQPYGGFLLWLTALGLLAFGALQFVEAVWRRVDTSELPKAAGKLAPSAVRPCGT
jgi:hypothetical protein